jgi:hypothetical protein
MGDDQFYSETTVYAWWFMLKYISRPYWAGMAEALKQAARSTPVKPEE